VSSRILLLLGLFSLLTIASCNKMEKDAYPTKLSDVKAEEAMGTLTRTTTYDDVISRSPAKDRKKNSTQPDKTERTYVFTVKEVDGKKVVSLGLAEFIKIAETSDVDFMRIKESLASAEESLRSSLRAYRPVFGGSVSTSYDIKNSVESQGVNFSLSQDLPWNGNLAVSNNVSRTHIGTPASETMSLGSMLSLSFDIYLRPGGYLEWRDGMLRAERAWIYAQRSFRASRENYLINKIQEFYSVVNSRKSLENQSKRLDEAQKALELTRFDYSRGQRTANDVYLAEENLVSTQQAIIDAQQNFEELVDDLKVKLDIPQECVLELLETPMTVKKPVIDSEEAIRVAMANNPEYQTQRDRYEDTRRSFTLSLYSLRLAPQLSVNYSLPLYDSETEGGENTNSSWSAAISWSYSLDQEGRKKQYRSLLAQWWIYERDFKRQQEENIKNIRRTVRSLENMLRSVANSERSYDIARRKKEVADLEYENGTIQTRDYNDAVNTLRSEEDRLNDARVSYRVAYLKYLSLLGQLEIDEEGEWLK